MSGEIFEFLRIAINFGRRTDHDDEMPNFRNVKKQDMDFSGWLMPFF